MTMDDPDGIMLSMELMKDIAEEEKSAQKKATKKGKKGKRR